MITMSSVQSCGAAIPHLPTSRQDLVPVPPAPTKPTGLSRTHQADLTVPRHSKNAARERRCRAAKRRGEHPFELRRSDRVPAINLDGHTQAGTVEVQDVWTGRMLPTEALSLLLAATELGPQP